MSWLSRLSNALRGKRLNRELDDELLFHIQSRADDYVRDGMSPANAESRARRELGNSLHLRESSRDIKLIPALDGIGQDFRLGIRILRKDRALTVAGLLSLSLAAGACLTAFSLIDALILRPLPVRQPERLVMLTFPNLRVGFSDIDTFSYRLYEQFRDTARGAADLFVVTSDLNPRAVDFESAAPGGERLRTQWMSGNGFEILGLRPALGRLFTASDDQPSSERAVAVLGYAVWKRRFGADPGILGKYVRVDTDSEKGKPFQIVGIAPSAFTGEEPGLTVELWLPSLTRASAAHYRDPDWGSFRIFGHLHEDASAPQLRDMLQPLFSDARREAAAGRNFIDVRLNVASAATGPSRLRELFLRPLWILAIIAGLVLLICCSNLANLFTARAAARQREMALRVAVGAGRLRLVRQMLVEGCILAFPSALIGLSVASFAAPFLVDRLMPAEYPTYLDLRLDWRVVAAVAFLGICSATLFALIPGIRASSTSPSEVLKSGGGQSMRLSVLRPLLAVQVAFSFIVLFVGGLLLVSFQRLMHVDLGFNKEDVLLLTVNAPEMKDEVRQRATALQILDRLRQVPQVQSAGLSAWGLMGGMFAPVMMPGVRIPGHESETRGPIYVPVSPGFFDAMRIRLLDGRDFQPRDTEKDVPSVIVNQAFVQRYFAPQAPLGRRFQRTFDGVHMQPQEIVGIVANAKYSDLKEPAPPTVYIPMASVAGATLEVRTPADPAALVPVLRQEIARIEPAVHITGITLQSTRVMNTVLRERLLALISGFFAVVAVVLAAVGLFGVLSYSVVRRTKEIGVRVALGAPGANVVRLIVRDVAVVLAIGVAAGMAGGIALARFVSSYLFEVKPVDPWSLALPTLFLLAASSIAALVPAMRATRVAPMVALRHE